MAGGEQRQQSYKRLLREIARDGPVPRIDLSERTGISRASVTTITADLLAAGLIEEVQRAGAANGTRGRPRVDLKIAADARLVAGVKVSDTSISHVLLDFDGQEIASLDQRLERGALTPTALAQEIANGLGALAFKSGRPASAISGVGVGLAGLVQAETGLVYWSPSLTERNVPFGDVLTAHLGRPVFVDNDANLVAMAELTFGKGKAHRDFIVITVEAGVGMGIVLDGKLYRGTRGSGGEFGHMKVELDGAMCRCGQCGCLEAYVADYALHREAVASGLVNQKLAPQQAMQQVLNAAQAGDVNASEITAKAGRVFALGLANLINIFDPERIILAGAQMRFDHLYADTVIAEARKSVVDIDKPPPDVVIHRWGDRMWALGAAAYALDFMRDSAVDEMFAGN